jgi:predicted O-methyltransferase YrrM
MRFSLLLIGVAAMMLPGADRKPDSEIEGFLPTLLEPGRRYANVEPAEGAYLRDLVRKVKAKKALEIGTSTGYSGIWIAMGLRETGGRLVTLEIDKGRYARAVENFKTVGLDALIDARLGDALAETPKVSGPLDFVFIDALKPDYLKYYEMVLPKMSKGGVIAAHNVVSHPREMQDFLDRIKSDPKVKTGIVTPGWQGFSISFVR